MIKTIGSRGQERTVIVRRVLKELLGEFFSNVVDFSFEFLNNTSESRIRNSFIHLRNLGINPQNISKCAHLLRLKPVIIQERWDNLISLGISPHKIREWSNILGYKPEKLNNIHKTLLHLVVSPEKIASHHTLLGLNVKTISSHYKSLVELGSELNPDTIRMHYYGLRKLGLSSNKITSNPNLLQMSPKTIESHYKYLIRLGLSQKKIATLPNLLVLKTETVKKNRENLLNLGVKPQKIAVVAGLLNMNPKSIKKNYNFLLALGIPRQRIINIAALLCRNRQTILLNFNYLMNNLRVDKKIIQTTPQILMENPDSFAKKMVMLKIDVLGVKRNSFFEINFYRTFFLCSPASLATKRKYCIENNIEYKGKFSVLKLSWKELIGKVDGTISNEKAKEIGKRLTRPLKQRYDKWMKEYKEWGKRFESRRGRRLVKQL